MTYEEFEWHILRLVYEDGLDSLQPSYLAYALGLPHETVSAYLEHATHSALLEMEINDDGRIEYRIPGVDRDKPLPVPVWKAEESQSAQHPAHQQQAQAQLQPQPQLQTARAVADRSQMPAGLRAHIEERYAGADGHIFDAPRPAPIIAYNAHVDEAVTALQRGGELMPFRVETTGESFCDPSQTVFMRQLRVHGVSSEKVLREHVQRLFESFGYRVKQSEEERVRFERGSVTFILALVPLFVLVLPLFVYLFLYCMGRSTIHQEPVELDVQFRKHDGADPYYEIDLTFIGLHGVVLGAADQRVLNQEIDTLREELRWSLTPG